jgi:hypothetical protein
LDCYYLSDNSNIGVDGFPKKNMIHEDGYHITSEGVAMLAANIKHAIDRVSQASGDSRGSPSRQGGFNTRTKTLEKKSKKIWKYTISKT